MMVSDMSVAAQACAEFALKPQTVARHCEAADKVDQCDEQIAFEIEAAPIRIGERELQRTGELVQADDNDERRILEQADESIDNGRHHRPQRLRQHDLALRLPVRQAEGLCSLYLAYGHRL